MARIIVTAEVADPEKWEEGFRTHGDLFRTQTVETMEYSINGNEVCVCATPTDLDAFMALFEAPATAEAMESDGINRDSVKVFVLDNLWEI